MKIILLKDVAKIGKRYETKDVADGFAVNSLLPRGLAIPATSENIKKISVEVAREAGEKKLHEELLAKELEKIEGKTVVYEGKTNAKGHLFAGLHAKDIAQKINIDPSYIVLDKPIKETGDHTIKIKAGNKTTSFVLTVRGLYSSE